MILVTGGTGFVGRHIVRRLLDERQTVRLLVRAGSRRDLFPSSAVEYAEGDVTCPESLRTAFAGIRVFIHLVGIIREKGNQTFERVHAEGTRSVVEAARAAGVRKLVHMSACGVRANAVSRYQQTKWAAEEAVRQSGIPYVIFRPSIICGPEDEFVNLFARLIRFPGALTRIMPVIGSGKFRMQPIAVDEVAACFVRAALEDGLRNTEYALGGPEPLEFNEIIRTILRVMGRRRRLVHLPVWLFKPVAWVAEKLPPNPLPTREQLIMLGEDNVCDIRAMRRDFSIEPKGFEEVIRNYLRPETDSTFNIQRPTSNVQLGRS